MRFVCLLFASVVLLISYSNVVAQDAANENVINMVVSFLTGEDDDIRALAFNQIRTSAPGEIATKKFAEQLETLPGPAKIGLLSALGDRGDAVAKPAVLKVLDGANDIEVRDAAINAIGKLGDASDTSRLIGLIASGDDLASTAAEKSLVILQGDGVADAIISGLNQASPAVQVRIVKVITTRRALDAIPTLMIYAVRNDAKVRTAAMKALGELAGPNHIAGMARGILKAKPGAERANAEKQVMFVCERIEDKNKQADPLLAAMRSMSERSRMALLPALGRIGGLGAIAEVEKAYSSSRPSVHTAGLRAFANWPDASIADRLISIAKTDKHADHQRMARMAVLRMAPLPDGRSDAEKLELLKAGMEMAASTSEESYALKRAAAIRLPETLRFVLPYLKDAKHAEQACLTIVELAHHRQLRDDNKAEFHAALDQVIGIAKDPVVVDRANRYKNGQTWVRPK